MFRHNKPRGLSTWRRATAAVIAGAVAITLNSAALAAADLFSLQTGRGGLLRLLTIAIGGTLPTPGPYFLGGFRVFMGLLFALFYAFVLARTLPGPSWVRGLLYATLVWVANAAVILPLAGEGFAGIRYLTPLGVAWFAVAHTLYFVVLAVLYEWLLTTSTPHTNVPDADVTRDSDLLP